MSFHAYIRTAMTKRALMLAAVLLAVVPCLSAQDDTDFDAHTIRISAFWFYSNPSGSFEGSNDTSSINLTKDFGFNSYSTFTGKVDWKFTHKNHFYVTGSSFNQTRLATLARTINFRGQTYDVGLSTKANLSAPLIAPGYQYDIIRRKRGFLGAAVQI